MIEMEYADGGTLRDLITKQDGIHFEEAAVLWSEPITLHC
jgi:hypothetical protein